MSFTVYFEDGHGKATDENGNEPVLMKIDEEGFPLDNIADYGTYIDLKPPEKEIKKVKVESPNSQTESGPSKYYKKHGSDVKNHFFHLVYIEGMTAGKAALQLGIARRTAYDWLAKDQKEILKINDAEITSSANDNKKVGRPRLLDEVHQKHLEEKFADHPSATLDQAMVIDTIEISPLELFESLKN